MQRILTGILNFLTAIAVWLRATGNKIFSVAQPILYKLFVAISNVRVKIKDYYFVFLLESFGFWKKRLFRPPIGKVYVLNALLRTDDLSYNVNIYPWILYYLQYLSSEIDEYSDKGYKLGFNLISFLEFLKYTKLDFPTKETQLVINWYNDKKSTMHTITILINYNDEGAFESAKYVLPYEPSRKITFNRVLFKTKYSTS